MQNYANFMHTVNLHSGRSSFISKDMTAIRQQLIEIMAFYDSVTFELTIQWQNIFAARKE